MLSRGVRGLLTPFFAPPPPPPPHQARSTDGDAYFMGEPRRRDAGVALAGEHRGRYNADGLEEIRKRCATEIGTLLGISNFPLGPRLGNVGKFYASVHTRLMVLRSVTGLLGGYAPKIPKPKH